MPPAELRPASTVVVLRGAQTGPFEVLLMRRNDSVAFMAGAYVFPGGRVDDADREAAVESTHRFTDASRFRDLTASEELPHRIAAVRELEEEAALRVSIDELIPIAHWVTPEIEIRRYDTRFYLVPMPDNQEARHDEGEMTELMWATPSEAVDRCRSGAILLPPPTWTTLRQLESLASLDEALEWARTKPIVRVQPGFLRDGHRTMLTLPGDPLHPSLPGWDVPEETRFVLEEGNRWKPLRV